MAKHEVPKKQKLVHAPPLGPAKTRVRHWGVMLSFLLLVVVPLSLCGAYLAWRAADQYTSVVAFTVRSDEGSGALDLLGGLSAFSGGQPSDGDILYQYLHSQDLVESVDQLLNLRSHFGAPYSYDPVLSLPPNASVEELLRYWKRMVLVSHEPATGLINVTVKAFDPLVARQIAEALLLESGNLVNRLSSIAREDALKFGRQELATAKDALRRARQDLTRFRSQTQVVDPSADLQLQMGLLTTLQQQLGSEIIAYDMLKENQRRYNPRLEQAEQRIAAIEDRIRQERAKLGGSSGEDFASLVEDFERLSIELEIAEEQYTNALASFAALQSRADRQSRYLATYIRPTLAETPLYPQRLLIFLLFAVIAILSWASSVLVYYSLRDRR